MISQGNHFLIRRCRIEDLDRVYEIERSSFEDAWPKFSLDYLFGLESSGFFVAEADGKVIGYAIVTIERTLLKPWKAFGHLLNIAVDPEFRGKGIGYQLLDAMRAMAARNGITVQTLEVRASNQAAINLYQKCGFVVKGIRPHYYNDTDEDALIMWADVR